MAGKRKAPKSAAVVAAPEEAPPSEPVGEPATEGRDETTDVTEPRYWRKNGWSAKVVKNEDDEGWSVEIHKDDFPEPVLVSPWVMGRDKKNPKPFDAGAFATFVKTASEVLDRSVRQREAALRKTLHLACDGVWYKIVLLLVPDEYEPHGTLTASTDDGQTVATRKVEVGYRLTKEGAATWVREGFKEP